MARTLDSEGVCTRCGVPDVHCQCPDVVCSGAGFVATGRFCPDQWFTICCRDCDDLDGLGPTPIPFETPEARGRWATAHKKGTGHDRWIVVDEHRPLEPDL